MRHVAWMASLALVVCAARGQEARPLSNRDAFALYGRAVELMESTAVSVPELARAGAPLTENARQAVVTLRGLGRQDSAVTLGLMENLRAYLALADAVPKPYPFPEGAAKQFVELREGSQRIEANFRALLADKERQLRNPDRDNLARYAEANEKLPAPAAGRMRVVFLGDSITDRWRLNEYFPERDYVNRGISGQVSGEMLGRMKPDVIALRPAAMVVLAGTNDLYRGVPLRTIENNLEMIGELAEHNRIRLVLASVLPVSDYHRDADPSYERTGKRPPARIAELNRWMENLCRARGYVYADYHAAMVDGAGRLKAELADDGLHPNAAGYRVMGPIAEAAIAKATAEGKGKKRGR